MEPLNEPNYAMTIFFLMLLAGVLIMAAYYLAGYKVKCDKRESEYNDLYVTIQDMIKSLGRTSDNYDRIEMKINKLRGMEYKNREKTKVLYQNFCTNFIDEHLKRQ